MSHRPPPLARPEFEPLEQRCLLSGTTLIFHGAQGVTQFFTDDPGGPDWVDGMGDAIASEIAASTGGSAGDVARFELDINGSTFGGMSTSWNFASGYSPGVGATSASAIDNALDGQTIIEVDWADVSNPIQSDNEDTTAVAARVADVLINQLGQLGHKLLAAPIHLAGHSRGASLIGALAEDFGQRGIWVDQLSFFDPVPTGGDFGAGGSVSVADNVVFAANYWQTNGSATDLDGAPVTGAHNVQLTHSIVSQGANGTGHSNTHVWYHATIDTVGPISDGDFTFDPDALNWFASNAATPTSPRDASGFAFSRIAHNAARPAAGLWDSAARFTTTVSNPGAAWSNVLLDTDWSTDITATAGGSLAIDYDYEVAADTATVLVGLDVDGNPYNGNEIVAASATATGLAGSGTQNLSVPLTGAIAGQSYRLFATITSDANGKERTDYAPRSVIVTAPPTDTTPPTVTELIVSSDAWSDAAFLQAIDPGRGLGRSIPIGASAPTELLPWSGLNRIHIVFSENVNASQVDLIVNGSDVAEYFLGGFDYDAATFTATWTLQQSIGVDKILVDVQSTVKDIAGNAMNEDLERRFNVAPGDTDRSGGVTDSDLDVIASVLGQSVGGTGYSVDSDTDGSGAIDISDFTAAKLHLDITLPTGEPIPTDIDTADRDEDRDRPNEHKRRHRLGLILKRMDHVRRALWAWRTDDPHDRADRWERPKRAATHFFVHAWRELGSGRFRR